MLYVKSVTEGMYDAPNEYVSQSVVCANAETDNTYTDTLTADKFTAVFQNNKIEYKDFTGVSCADGSPAVYAGNSARNSGNTIQLRSKNSNSGIVTTTSGGKVKKIIIQFASNTPKNSVIDVYGKSTAYTAASDLYDTITQGTKIGGLTYNGTDATVELNVTEDYEYIGLRSKSGAIYITSIIIVWEK